MARYVIRSMNAIPDDVQVDIVNIFRRPGYTASMVEDVIERVKRTGEKPVIWTQIGVSSRQAQSLADEAGTIVCEKPLYYGCAFTDGRLIVYRC